MFLNVMMDFIYRPPLDAPEIIFSDEDIVIVDKFAGLLSVPGRRKQHQDSLFMRLQKRFPTVSCVHRLDMDTSGLMVWALNKDSHRRLSRQFENKQVQKTYAALVDGLVTEDSGSVDAAMRCDWPNRPLQMIDPVQGKQALTDWRVIERDPEALTTRLLLFPKTGRSHQLRVHCRHMGHVILGDRFYGTEAVISRTDRLCLHAQKLGFTHPSTGLAVSFESDAGF